MLPWVTAFLNDKKSKKPPGGFPAPGKPPKSHHHGSAAAQKRISSSAPPRSALQAALRDGARPATAPPYLGSPPCRHGSPRAQMAHGGDADSRGDEGRRLSSPSTFQCRFGASPTSSKWLRVPARAEQCERGTERRAAGAAGRAPGPSSSSSELSEGKGRSQRRGLA